MEKTDAIYNLIPEDKQAAYDAVQVRYLAQLQELDKERDRLRTDAEKKVKELLTPKQWDQFLVMKQQRGPGRRNRGGSTGPVGPGVPPSGGTGFPGKHPRNDPNRAVNDAGHPLPAGSDAVSK